MELSLPPYSSPRVSVISPRPEAPLFYRNQPISSTCKVTNLVSKCSKNLSSIGLYDHKSCSRTVYKRRHKCFSIKASTQIGSAGSYPVSNKVSEFRDAFWRFLRPHTIRGTALGSIPLVTGALIENQNLIRWSLLLKAVSGLLALICGNGYIVGINQIYDIGIDKINKPYLPMAKGDLSVQSALVFGVTVCSSWPFDCWNELWSIHFYSVQSWSFFGNYLFSSPTPNEEISCHSILIIATVQGFLLNFGVYYATRGALGLPFKLSSPVAFITTFVTLFVLVIAITKDLSDVEGDRKFQISTLATKLGVRNIAFLYTGLLLINCVGSLLAAIYMPQAFRGSLMIPAQPSWD